MVATAGGISEVTHVPRTRAEKLQAALQRTQALGRAAGPSVAEPRLHAERVHDSPVLSVSAGGAAGELPASLLKSPRGTFESAIAPAHEALRDFSRIMLSSERRVFIMARGMVSMRPLQLGGNAPGLDLARIGELDTKLLERSREDFKEAILQRLAAAGCSPLDAESIARLRDSSVLAMSANVGIDFTIGVGLVPAFLQPIYVLALLGGSATGAAIQAHMLVYGFVAGRMEQVMSSELELKSTPFCACLMSPDLLRPTPPDAEKGNWTWEYSVRRVSISNIREAAERDAQLLRESVKLGRFAAPMGLPSEELEAVDSKCEASVVPPATIAAASSRGKAVPAGQSSPGIDSMSRLHQSAGASSSTGVHRETPRKEPSMFASFWSQAPWAQAQRRVDSAASSGPLRELSPRLAASPSGHFESIQAAGPEALRNFARLFLVKGHQRRVYIMARGMVSMRPLQLAGGIDTSRMGDMDEEMVEQAQGLFMDALSQWLSVVGAPPVPADQRGNLCAAAAAAMSGSIGIDFSQHAGLLPMFMQPMFVLLILAGHADVPPQARLITYGFVAGNLSQAGSGRTEIKSTPFCARLTSPDLLAAGACSPGESWEWEYSVYRVRSASIKEAAERDAARLREAVGSGKWEQ